MEMIDKQKPPSESQPNLSFEELALKEAEYILQTYRNDYVRIEKAMEARKKQVEVILNDQKADERGKIKVSGSIVALQHLVNVYRNKLAKIKETKKQKSSRKNAKNRNNRKSGK